MFVINACFGLDRERAEGVAGGLLLQASEEEKNAIKSEDLSLLTQISDKILIITNV